MKTFKSGLFLKTLNQSFKNYKAKTIKQQKNCEATFL